MLGKYLVVGGTLGLAAVTSVTSADAAGMYVREHSTSAMMTGFAGSASRGDDSSHLFYNPATIIKNKSVDITSDYRVFFPDVEITATSALSPFGMAPVPAGPSSTGNMADVASFAPSFFGSYALTDRLSVGIGGSGPVAVAIDAGQTWLGRFQVTKTRMTTMNFNPVAAYRLTDWITVGAGLQVQYYDANLQNVQAVAPGVAGTGYLRGNDWGVGFTAGVLIEPTAYTTIGIGYRSRIKHEVKGRSGIQGIAAPVPSTFNFTTPDILTASVSHAVTDNFSVHGTFEWANWSLFDSIVVQTPGLTTVRPQNWEDTYSGFGGVSWDVDEKTTIGGGIGYTTAVTDGSTSSISPDGDRITVAAGISHQVMRNLTMKASYAHVFFDDTNLNIPFGPSGSMTGKSEIDIHVLAFSGTAHW